jgi:uncharacterized membrane protein YfcA
VPLLALLEPRLPTAAITAISLAVVAMNAGSGALAYAHARRIDYRSGIPFALATLPGSIGGALATRLLPRSVFDVVFAILLVGLGGMLLRSRVQAIAAPEGAGWGRVVRELEDREGRRHQYVVHMPLGIAISFVVGFASSLLGIGGGVIHVPALVGLLGFPTHIATATSHFVLAIMASVGTGTHLLSGDLSGLLGQTLVLGIGAVVGAQIGARLSARVHSLWIERALAVSLLIVGVRLGAQAFLGS